MLKACSMLASALVATQVFGQSPPTVPRTQSPAQGNAQPAAGQPARENQVQPNVRDNGVQRSANYRGEVGANQNLAKMIDGHLAACLILGNEEEVALGQFAGERASTDKVKKFAKTMVDAHTKALSQLKAFAPEGASLELSQVGDRSSARTGQERSDASSGARQTASSSESNVGQQLLAIEREAKQQCLDLTQRELGELRGEEFDHAYLGQQMVGHVQMIAALTAFEQHASPELQKVIVEQKKTAEQHLDHIKQLKQSGHEGATSQQSSN